MQTLAQNFGLFTVVKPADLNGSSLSKSNATFLSLKGYNKVTFVITMGATADASWSAAAYQAKNVSGSSVSATALPLTHYWTNKSSVSTTALVRTVASSSKLTVTSVNNTVFALEYDAKQLNANSSFDCVCLGITNIGSASTFGQVLAILHDPRYAADGMPVNARAN